VIDGSTDVCVIAMLDAFSLKDTKLGLETHDLIGYDREAVRVLINRADSHVGIGLADVKAILGRQPDVLVPSDRDIPRSVTEGSPIVASKPGSAAAKEFHKLAAFYTDNVAAPTDVPAPELEPIGSRRFHLRRA
jgi:pilus assembly protein CpaE